MKKIALLLIASATILSACDKKTSTTTPTTNNNTNPTTVDPTTYDQYITCKIDGTTYTAYYAAGHTTNLNCVYNTNSQTSFESSADEVKDGGETLLSEMQFTLYGYKAKQAGTYTCPDDLYLDGSIERMVNGSKQRITYVISHQQSLVVTSSNNGIIEGTFAVQVQDENDPTKLYNITGGKFRIRLTN